MARNITREITREITSYPGEGHKSLLAFDITGDIASTVDLDTATSARTSESGHDWDRISAANQRLFATTGTDDVRGTTDADDSFRQYHMDLSGEDFSPREIQGIFLNSTAPVKGTFPGYALLLHAQDALNYTYGYVYAVVAGTIAADIYEVVGGVLSAELASKNIAGAGTELQDLHFIRFMETPTGLRLDASSVDPELVVDYIGPVTGSSKNVGVFATSNARGMIFSDIKVFA